jgi:hypothetical protein
MVETAHHAASAQQRFRLFPALSLKIGQTLEQATAIATGGGPLAVTVTNNGLAAAFRPYVESVRFTFTVGAPNGLFVRDLTADGTGFWRRARAGERFAPDQRLVEPVEVPIREGSPATGRRFRGEGPGSVPEAFMSGPPEASRLAMVGTSALQPTQTADVSVALPPLPPDLEGGDLTSWCIGFRCFDLLTDSAPAAALPVPAQPAHHLQLICLHTGT